MVAFANVFMSFILCAFQIPGPPGPPGITGPMGPGGQPGIKVRLHTLKKNYSSKYNINILDSIMFHFYFTSINYFRSFIYYCHLGPTLYYLYTRPYKLMSFGANIPKLTLCYILMSFEMRF